MAKENSMQLFLAIQFLAAGLLGCPGDGSDGASPVLFFSSTPECRVIAGGFPSGFAPLPGAGNEAAVVQFAPPAVFGLNLESEPPSLLATNPVPPWPEIASPLCGGNRVDSDLDGRADADLSQQLGFLCQKPAPGRLHALSSNLVALTTSGYEQIVFIDPRSGELRVNALAPPSPSPSFDPDDWPFWPAAGVLPFQSGFSTRACVYGGGLVDSNGGAIGTNTRCDGVSDGFFTSFTSDVAFANDRLFASTANLIQSSTARFAPGTVLVFDLDSVSVPPRAGPHPTNAILVTTGYNPTSLTPYTTPAGRELILVGVSGAIALGTGPGLVTTDSSVDIIDATTLEVIATIPLGRAGLGFGEIAIDPTSRIGLVGAATERSLYGIDLAVLDDPTLGTGPQTLPIVLDGMTPGFGDGRLFDASTPFELPKRPDGPLDSTCTTQTSVAIKANGSFAVASDFCDGTISQLDLALPAARTTPLDPMAVLLLDRSIEVVAPLVPTASGEIRAPSEVQIRPGIPGVDFDGPDVHFTTGLPEGAVCGARIENS